MTANQASSKGSLSGTQKAAALLMLLGEQHGAPLWSHFSDTEVKSLSLAMTALGQVKGPAIDGLLRDFEEALTSSGVVTGTAERAEELLAKVLPPERAASAVATLRGAGGRQVWPRMAQVPADAIARFLLDEHPQTVAVILSRLGSDQGGRILALLPEKLGGEVVSRLLTLGHVQPQAFIDIEDTLYRQFLEGGPRKPPRDPYETMADRFNEFDRPTEARFLAALERQDGDVARRIREKMFTFEDLLRLDAAGAQTLLRVIDKDALARALKGASEAARTFFLANMSTRAAKNLQDDMEALGPLRVREVDDAQSQMVRTAKDLADKGEIRISKGRTDEEVVG